MGIGRQLFLYLILLVLAAISGKQCSPVTVHPTNNATFIKYEGCMVNTQVPYNEFVTLTTWCNEQHALNFK